MNMDKDAGVLQITFCPGGKRTSSKEAVIICDTKRITIERKYGSPIHARHPSTAVASTLIRQNEKNSKN